MIHVEASNWEVDKRVHFHAEKRAPSEPLQVQAQHLQKKQFQVTLSCKTRTFAEGRDKLVRSLHLFRRLHRQVKSVQ